MTMAHPGLLRKRSLIDPTTSASLEPTTHVWLYVGGYETQAQYERKSTRT